MYSSGDPRIDALLAQRARELARPPAEEEPSDSSFVIAFSLGDQHYAVDASAVREVVSLRSLTAVPCTPDFVAGVVNIRGNLLSLIDLAKFLEIPLRGVTDLTEILVLNAAGIEAGILTHEVLGLRLIPAGEIKPPLPNDDNVAREFVTGVTSDLTVVLDIERIFSDPGIVVHEEVRK